MLLLFSCTESWACGTYVLILLAVEIVMLVFISEDGGESILRTAIQMGGFAGMIYFLWQALVLLFTLPIFLAQWVYGGLVIVVGGIVFPMLVALVFAAGSYLVTVGVVANPMAP